MSFPRLGSALLASALCGLLGCGGNDRPKTIPISGKVTINGQAPGEGGKIYFTPTEAAAGYNKRPASGSFDPEGNYRVMSWEPDDGLVPGHYAVNVQPGDPAKTRIPAKYQNSATSELEVDSLVDQDEIKFDIDIKTE
jgi:hypothetical protein